MSISLSGYFTVLAPDTGDWCAIFWVECSRTLDIVCFEVTIEFLPVRYVQHPSSILWIINKLSYIMLETTLVFSPVLIQIIKIPIIKLTWKWFRIFIVNCTLPWKLIIYPLTLICKFIRLVVKFTIAMHFILFPFTIIHTTILIIKFAFSMS